MHCYWLTGIIFATAVLLQTPGRTAAAEQQEQQEQEQDCLDEHEACLEWAASGECDKNPEYMHTGCPKSCDTCPEPVDPALIELGDERVTMEIEGYGTIVLGFYPNAAPITVAHISQLFRDGCYDTNHIFRVHPGFVAQVQLVDRGSVLKELSSECLVGADTTVPGEFTAIPHERGTLSMGRQDGDFDSGSSSFSMLLGHAPHLDGQYTVFGKVISGYNVLASLEEVETYQDGIMVMPKHRITISSATIWTEAEEEEL